MIVVDPDQVIGFVPLDHFVRKNAIGFDVCFPAFRVKPQLRREIVEHRPESSVGIALVESGRDFLWQVNRETSFFFRPLGKDRATFKIALFSGIPGPTNPFSFSFSEKRIHSAGQSPRTSARLPTFLGSLQGQWESVRDDKEACVFGWAGRWKSVDRF